jgi:hypothetical protein
MVNHQRAEIWFVKKGPALEKKEIQSVLWIRIRSDQKLLAGSFIYRRNFRGKLRGEFVVQLSGGGD